MEKLINKLSKELKYLGTTEDENSITIKVASKRDSAVCPNCNSTSTSVQSKYNKKFQDLPLKGKTVYIQLVNRTFNCSNPNCKCMFVESFDFIEPNQHDTKRLIKHILEVSSTCSNRAAEKKLREEGIQVGKSTIARLMSIYKSE